MGGLLGIGESAPEAALILEGHVIVLPGGDLPAEHLVVEPAGLG